MEWQSGGGCCIYIFAFVRAKQKAAWVERGSAPPPSAPARTQQAVLVRTDVSLCGDGLKVGVKHAGDWERASKVPSNGECSVRRLTSLGTSGTIVRCSGASRATPDWAHPPEPARKSGWDSGVGIVEERCSLRQGGGGRRRDASTGRKER